jgi:hypothetical protein
MSDHDEWVQRGFCEAIYVDEDEGEHWCRLPSDHKDPLTGDPDKHVAPWRYEFPRQETMVRWLDGPLEIEWVEWKPDPPPTI